MTKHLPDELWTNLQVSVPIFCVDVVPLRDNELHALEIGLILRKTPEGSTRWCFIGGRLEIDELVEDATRSELHEALGESLQVQQVEQPEPLLVQYSRTRRPGFPFDPRQHAVSVTILLWMIGEGISQGREAIDFRWWPIHELDSEIMGFGQEVLLPRIQSSASRRVANNFGGIDIK